MTTFIALRASGALFVLNTEHIVSMTPGADNGAMITMSDGSQLLAVDSVDYIVTRAPLDVKVVEMASLSEGTIEGTGGR